jgi:hypothetical protein
MEIIYIAGNGRSGSTILAMLLELDDSRFCAGELTFITRPGISEEPCSCRATIGTCEMWQAIMASWGVSRQISLARYAELRHAFELNRRLPRLLLNVLWPGRDFLDYCKATRSLFEAIGEITGAKVIIDSSKSPGRIMVLRRFSSLSVIHLCRDFSGVANSYLRASPKNVEKGIETDLNPIPPRRTFVIWLLNNVLTTLLSVGVRRCRLSFQRLVIGQFGVLADLGYEVSVSPDESFSADHMLAGNKLRLNTAKLDSDRGFSYERLTASQSRFASWVDRVFSFWT